MSDREKKPLSVLNAIIGIIGLLIIIGTLTTSMAVSQSNGVSKDIEHDADINKLELRDVELEKEHDEDQKEAQARHDETIKILHRIELKVENKQDRP